jgi:uncharacterized protein
MSEPWEANLVESTHDALEILRTSRTVAVLGIKTEAQAGQPGFFVAEYLQRVGYEIIPVPIYYPQAEEILGRTVFRSLAAIPDPIDLVVVFRRSADVAGHVDDMLTARPKAVWMQSGIRNEEAARQLARAGILVVQDRCTMIDHRRLR